MTHRSLVLTVTAAAVLAAAGLGALAAPAEAAGRVIVVSPTGDDAGAGTAASPWRSIQKAVDAAGPGDTVALRGGTYLLTSNIQLAKSGTAAARITLKAFGTEKPVVDGEGQPGTPAPVGGSVPGSQRGVLHLTGSFWRIAGLELVHGPYGLYCENCSDNVFDRMVTRDNYESGFHIQGHSARNRIVNLDSYGNHDPRNNGENADGLAIKEGDGAGNVVRGARLWNNADDGLDLWLYTSPVVVQNSISYGNGVNRWALPSFAGDGNGFKLGGSNAVDPAAAHVLRNDMAFDNVATGFTDNGNPGDLRLVRCTAFGNGKTGFSFANSTATLTANLAVDNASPASTGAGATQTGNSWQRGTWTPAQLAGTDPAVITGPRTATGAIPTSPFLRPADGTPIGAAI